MEHKQEIFVRGSEWRKWDLHVHSPASFFWRGGNLLKDMNAQERDNAMKDFVKTVNESEVAVFCIMDYWTFDWCIELRKYSKTHPEALKKPVFNGMELRVECPVDYRLNIHVILSDELTEQQLNDFKSELKIRIGSNLKNLSNEALISLAKSFGKDKAKKHGYDEPTSLGDDQLLELGSKTAEVTKDSLLAAFKHIPKDAGYIILPYDTSDGLLKLDWSKHPQDDNFFMQTATIFESRDRRNIDLFNGKKTEENKEFFENFYKTIGSFPKPCVSGSDAHSFPDYGVYPSERITWIKADPSFEGLKQIVYEPRERVSIQERNPSESKTRRLFIDRANYKTSSDEKISVYFNQNLNSIIGKRGNGKSTLLKNIAKKIDNDEFTIRDKKDPYTLIDFEVIWGDGQKNEGTDDSPKSIFYIPQGYLSALAYDDGERITERDIFLTKLLKKNEHFANAIKSYDNFVSNNRVHIEQLVQKLLAANASIEENEALIKKQGAQKEIVEEKNKKMGEIQKYKGADVTDEEINNYSEAQKIVENSKKQIDILKQDKDILTTINETGASVFISDQVFSLLSSTRQELIQKELQNQSEQQLKVLISKEIGEIDQQIQELSLLFAQKEKVVNKLEDKITKTKVLHDLTKEFSVLEEAIDTIKDLEAKIAKSRQERDKTIDALVNAYNDFETHQNAIYKTIKFDEKFSFLKVEVVAKYNTQQLKKFVERNINTRDSDPNIKSEEDIQILFGASPKKLSTEIIKKLISGLINGKIRIKVEAGDVSSVLAELLRNRFEIDYPNSVKTIDGQTHFKDMTGGQKAIALLELIFRFDDEKYPILIDQPEDDLDVGGVASDLVNFIISEKQDRQIIIVTHNASLVICADTENVINSVIQKNGSSKYNFLYETGSIENSQRRKDIIEVLEGGIEALQKRMQKLQVIHNSFNIKD